MTEYTGRGWKNPSNVWKAVPATCASLSAPNLNSPVQYFTLISRGVPTAQGAAIPTVLDPHHPCLQARTLHRLLCTGHCSPHPHPAVMLRWSLVRNTLFCSSFWHLVWLLNFPWFCATLEDLEQKPVLNKVNYSLKLLQNSLSENYITTWDYLWGVSADSH